MIYLLLADRLLLSAVLILAGIGKLATPWSFARTVELVGVPQQWSRAGAYGVIICELSLGSGFALGWQPATISILGALLLLMFAGVSAYVARTGLTVGCNCFGQSSSELGTATAIRCLGLAGLAGLYGISSIVNSPNKLMAFEPAVPLLTFVVFLYLLWRWIAAVRIVGSTHDGASAPKPSL
jgi:hypothetical protein